MARWPGALLGFGAAFVFAGAFYLLLIDTTSSPELYAGLAATILAAAVTEAARRNGLAGVVPRAGWVARGWRAVAQVPQEIAVVSAEALAQVASPRPVRGVMRAVPFRYGGRDDPRDMARRALTEAIASLPPNTIVLGIDEEHDLLLVHQLRRRGGREALDVLDLG